MFQYIRTPAEAELNAAQRMREMGYWDARADPRGADGGIDVFAAGALAQVKWKASVAGRPDLQRLFGARASDFHKQLFFFASSGYSAHAIEFAEVNYIALFTYDPLGTITPVNDVARYYLHGPWQGAMVNQHQQPAKRNSDTAVLAVIISACLFLLLVVALIIVLN